MLSLRFPQAASSRARPCARRGVDDSDLPPVTAGRGRRGAVAGDRPGDGPVAGARAADRAARAADGPGDGPARRRSGGGLLHRRAALRRVHRRECGQRGVLRGRAGGAPADDVGVSGFPAGAHEHGDAGRSPGERTAYPGSRDGQVRVWRRGRVPQVGRQPLRRRPDTGRADGLAGAGSGGAAAPV